MGLLSSIAISVLGGLFLVWGSRELQSAFILDFLRTNLLLLLPALMAINVTTSGVVMAKLRDLGDKHKAGFSSTISAIKSSFYEQTVLMIVATILLIIEGAKGSIAAPHHIRSIIDSLICGCFIYSILVLYDTAKGIFIIMNFEDENTGAEQ